MPVDVSYVVIKQYHPTAPVGTIFATSPPEGVPLTEGQVVTLYESLGPYAMMGQIWT